MTACDKLADCSRELIGAGLSETATLKSTGIAGHIARLEKELVSEETLMRYAADLRALAETSGAGETPIPSDFWDVRTKKMKADWWDEYTFAHRLAKPEYREYVSLLGRCFRHLLAH